MSVAALLAESHLSKGVLSRAVSPDVSSLPSPVAQLKPLTPEELGSRLDKAFDDLVDVGCLPGYVDTHEWEDLGRDLDRGASFRE